MAELKRFLLCFSINILLFSINIFAVDDNKFCVKTPKLNYLSDYTKLINNMRMCNRVANTKSIVDDEGRIYLSYRIPLNKDEDPNDLCNCMRSYILQGDWWIGAKHFCYVECDIVTLMLIGTPEKKFVHAEPVYMDKEPINALSEFYGIYSNTQIWKDNCSAKPEISLDGSTNVVWTCDYSGSNLPPPDVLCEYMYNGVSGSFENRALSKYLSHSCTVKGDKFYFNVAVAAGGQSLEQLIANLSDRK